MNHAGSLSIGRARGSDRDFLLGPARAVALAAALGAVTVAFAACREPSVGGPASGARAGTCGPSSVAKGGRCPDRALPPSNASSTRGCRSDAECTQGRQGRCVRFGVSLAPAERSSLLAEAPAPPPETICAYDECEADAKMRCECGAPGQRYRCVGVDRCMGDRDCGEGSLCACGASGAPNQCVRSTCRTDADCAGGYPCVDNQGGRYCRSGRDRCKSSADCERGSTCDFSDRERAFVCVPMRIMPPG